MTKRVLSYGVVGLLALALVVGTAYILLNPTQAQAERGSIEPDDQYFLRIQNTHTSVQITQVS